MASVNGVVQCIEMIEKKNYINKERSAMENWRIIRESVL